MKTYTTYTQSGNRVEEVKDLTSLMKWWDFIASGLADLNDPHKGRGDLTVDSLFRNVVYSLSTGGVVLVLTSKNGKGLAYVIARDNTEPYCQKSLLVFAAYSTGKFPHAREQMLEYLEQWAKKHGFAELHAFSRRVNGAAVRWFEQKCGFRRICMGFRKVL